MLSIAKRKLGMSLLMAALLAGCATKAPTDKSSLNFTTNTAPDPVKPVVGNLEEGLRLARMLRDNGRLEGAADVYAKLAQRGDLNGTLYLEYASVAATVSSPNDALTLFAQAKQAMGGDVSRMSKIERVTLCNGMGRARLALGQIDDAMKDFSCVLDVDPRNVIALNGKAVLLDAQGQHHQAQQLLTTAREIDPANLMVINNLALSYLSEGNNDEAIRLLTQLDIPKNQPSLKLNLAFAYVLKDNNKQAEDVLGSITSPELAKRLLTQLTAYKTNIKQGASVSTALLTASRQLLALQEAHQ